MRKTALFQRHKDAGAKMVDFGGWLMPVSYQSVLKEHAIVREGVGIFDVSHMGEIFISGPQAQEFCQHLTINDIKRLEPGKGQYSAMLNEEGGFIDDLIVYQTSIDEYLLCTNASNTEKDYQWITSHLENHDVQVKNRSDDFAQLAIQGPRCNEVMQGLLDENGYGVLLSMEYMSIRSLSFKSGFSALVARTGYTGEKGYEIYLDNKHAPSVWESVLQDSARTGAAPIGLGARDTLRLEACYLLYGNEINDTTTPIEAGIGWATRLETDGFIGKSAIVNQNPACKIAAFVMEEPGIPRHGMKVFSGDKEIGQVTSGSVLPSLGANGGMAFLDVNFCQPGAKVEVDVRGKRRVACIKRRPLYESRT